MTKLSLTVNGKAISAELSPRMSLADFLRDKLSLTGTHIGCEHGACGACTVLLDGKPIRSCIALAVSCEGASVTTIEGYDDDPLMAELREAFREEHALQCGYCTPGMLAMARDLAQRLKTADTDVIRRELAGCICRCTGYRGIVRAIARTIASHMETR